MKLYDVPRETRIKLDDGRGGLLLNFHHIDGAYSLSTDDEGNVYHLQAWTEVEIVEE